MAALATPDIVVSAGLRGIRETLSGRRVQRRTPPDHSWIGKDPPAPGPAQKRRWAFPTPSRFVALGLTPRPPTRTLLGWMPIASAATRPAYGPDADAA